MTYRVLMDADEIRHASDEADLGGDGEWVAFSDHDRLIIGVNPNHHDDVNRVALLHELLHCCLRVSGAWPDAYAQVVASARGKEHGVTVEEFTIAGLAGTLLAVLQDNPSLVDWCLERTGPVSDQPQPPAPDADDKPVVTSGERLDSYDVPTGLGFRPPSTDTE